MTQPVPFSPKILLWRKPQVKLRAAADRSQLSDQLLTPVRSGRCSRHDPQNYPGAPDETALERRQRYCEAPQRAQTPDERPLLSIEDGYGKTHARPALSSNRG